MAMNDLVYSVMKFFTFPNRGLMVIFISNHEKIEDVQVFKPYGIVGLCL
jgi:uncharacterized membrane protein (UPF0127 family)